MATKRKKVVVTMDKRLDALRRIDKGESLKAIAEELGVGTSTVSDWKKNRNQIEDFCLKMMSKDSLEGRGTAKKAKNVQLDEALFVWFCSQRERGVTISGPILAEKAVSLNSKLPNPEPNFKASQGWLDRFKKRHGIRQLTVTGESLSGDAVASEKFKKEFEQIIASETLTADQIYNADETGLFYRVLPNKTLASKIDKSAKGFKKSKDRLTAMACSNASGKHKLPLVIIGKSKNPRALKNVNRASLPVVYEHQKRGWMEGTIFKNWFFKNFVPDVKMYLKKNNLPQKAILFLDNAPSHPDEEELVSGDIKVKFLPPNVTALLQPMDQGVLENIKRVYRRKLLSKMIEEEGELNVISLLKSVNVKDVIYMVADAWDHVTEETIKKSWKKIWPTVCKPKNGAEGDTSQSSENDPDDPTFLVTEEQFLGMFNQIDGCSNLEMEDIQLWLKDDNDGGYSAMTDEEIIASCSSTQQEDSDSGEEEGETSNTQPEMTHAAAMFQLENIMTYLERQPETAPAELLVIKRLRDRAAVKRHTKVKQRKIDDFFITK